MQRIVQLVVVFVVMAAAIPVGAMPEPPGKPDGHRYVPATGDPAGPLAVAGEFLAKLDPSFLPDREIRPVGFGWSLINDASPLAPAARAAQLTVELGVVVVPNGVSRLLADNPEPDAEFQWPLDNTSGVVDADIDGEEAWDITRGAGVVVAVLDSGIDLAHADLADAIWVNPGEIPGNGDDDDNNGYIDDVNGWDFRGDDNDLAPGGEWHGSFVAGIVAAPINGVGIAGVAPEAVILPLQVCDPLCPDSDVIEALAYAVSAGADVVNLSLGRGPNDLEPPADLVFEDAVAATTAAGVTVVAAAGNDGADNDTADPEPAPLWPVYPASFPVAGLLSVAMTDDTDSLDPASNYGATTVDLAAPGVEIYSTAPTAIYPSGYVVGSGGTSYAAPHVAGVAALVLAADPCLTPTQVEARIKRTADDLPGLTGRVASNGRLNARRAVTEYRATADATTGGVPLTVAFTMDACSGTFPWDFGDGSGSGIPSPSHIYTEVGIYEASVDTGTGVQWFEIVAGLAFTDTEANPFEDEITWLSAAGVTLGCDPSGPRFCPDGTVTRGQMASFLARALDLPAPEADYFADDTTSTHQDNINRLRESGVTVGCNADGTEFCPDDPITREQMATFLTRGYGLAPSAEDYFTDDGGTHEANINALAASGITLGCEASEFCPKDPVPRRQMAAFLFRADDL